MVHVGSSQVEVVNEFTYLGACTTCDGSSESEILRRIGIARNCMTLLEKHVWKSHIRIDTKVRSYQTYVLPVLMYGSEAWTVTKALARRLDVFDKWSLRKSFGSRILDTLPTLLSGRLPAALQFQVSLKQEGSASLATWHVQSPGKIIIQLSMRRCDHQETGGDLEGALLSPG